MKRFFMVFITIFIFLLNIQNVISQTDLIGYWKFDEGTGSTASDSSGYGNDGTIVASGRNQVNNPSFEMGKQDWGSGSGTWDIVSDEKYHEVNSSRFQDLIGDAGSEYAGNVYIPVNPDEAITISAYSRGDNIVLGSQSWHRALLVGRWINSTGHNLCDNNPAICPAPYTPWPDMLLGDGTGTWDWKRSTITRIPPPTAVEYRFSVGLRGSGTGTLWVDAVQVENGGTATDFTDTPWIPPSDSVSGQSLEFDGRNDYVNLGDKFDDLPTSGSSILWWAKFSDNTTPTTQRFWGKHTNFEVRWPSGTQVIHFDVGGTDTLTTGISFEEDKWYHLAFVWNSTDSSFYVDGTYMADGNPVASLPQTADEFHIGEGGINRGTQNFNGIMDEFKIYNRTLSSTEIYNEYIMGQSNLVGYWKFDDGIGSTASDSSGYGNDGTLSPSCPDCPSWTSDSISGEALDFDGSNDYVNLVDKFDDLPTSGSSMLWWAKFDDNSTPATQRFWGKHTDYEVRWISGTQVIHFDVGATDALTTTIPFEENEWYHLAFVWNSTDSSFYVDGTYMADGNPVASLPQTADEFHIGEGGINRGTQNFNGIMDEFKIYNRTLSSTEIYNEYQLGITPTTTTTTTTSSTTTTLGPPSYDFNMWAEGQKLFTIGKQEIFNVYIQNNGNTDDSYTISYSKQAFYETQDVSHLIDVSLRSNRINKVEPNRTGNTFATVILKGPISSGSITFNASSISNPSLKSTANPVEIITGYSINLPEFGLMGLMLLILISSLIISYSSHFR